MTIWILAALAIYLLQTIAPPLLLFFLRPDPQLSAALGSRDTTPEPSRFVRRLQRALVNYQEALTLFLPIALIIEFRGLYDAQAALGAMLFVGARALYPAAYASGVFGLRSAVWTVGLAGLIIIALRLIETL